MRGDSGDSLMREGGDGGGEEEGEDEAPVELEGEGRGGGWLLRLGRRQRPMRRPCGLFGDVERVVAMGNRRPSLEGVSKMGVEGGRRFLLNTTIGKLGNSSERNVRELDTSSGSGPEFCAICFD